MAIIGFNFTTINVERTGTPSGKVNIKNNISITDIESRNFSLGSDKQDGLRFLFEFISEYEPDFAKIKLGGEVLFLENKENVKAILDEWKKNKKVAPGTMSAVLNTALSKCNVKALILSEDVNLPPPIPLPKVEAKK